MPKKQVSLKPFRNIRKCELHAHIDGSIRPQTMVDIAKKEDIRLPTDDSLELDPDTLHGLIKFRIGMDLKTCLESFKVTLKVMQSYESIRRITMELCEDLAKDNVTDAELRYCPTLHIQNGLKLDDVVKATLEGIEEGKKFGIDARLIFCAIRDFPVAENMKLVRLAGKYQGRVVGIDLAGNEYDHPPEEHKKVFDLANDMKLYITAHGGEMKKLFNKTKQKAIIEQGIKNMYTLMRECHVDRVGHGVSMMYDKNCMREFKDRGLTLEVSFTSNRQTGAITRYEQHPVERFFRFGIKTVMCSDDLMLCDTDLSKEMRKACEHSDLSINDMEKMTKYAHDARFIY